MIARNILAGLLASCLVLPTSVLASAAVAIDKSGNHWGYCYGKATVSDAKQCAMAICQRAGGSCVIKAGYGTGVYGAIAPGKGVVGFSIGYHENEGQEMASGNALRDCFASYAEKAGCDEDDKRCQAASACKIKATWKDVNATEPPESPPRAPSQEAKAKELNAKGQALLREKRFDEAIAVFTQAIAADPSWDGSYNSRGVAYAEMAPPNYDAARRDYDTAIRLNPEAKVVYWNRAILNKKTGRQQAYLDDLNRAAQLGGEKAKELLNAQTPSSNATSQAQRSQTSGGYQTCSLPSDQIASRGGVERATDRAYANVCIAILPPSCRNWTMNHQPCAVRTCIVTANLNRCPDGEPPSYVAKEAIPFTQADFAAMDSQIDAEAKHIAAQRGNGNAAMNPSAQYWQTQIMHRQTEWANGNAGGVTYGGQ